MAFGRKIIRQKELAALKPPDKMPALGSKLKGTRKARKPATKLPTRPPTDDAALLYTHERMLDLERRMVALLAEYRSLLDEVGLARADAQDAKNEALHAHAMRQITQGEWLAWAVTCNALFESVMGVALPLPDFTKLEKGA